MGASSQRKGAETSPWPGSGTQSATWLRTAVQGWARGRVRRAPFPGGEGAAREVPYGRSQEGPPSQGSEVDIRPEQAAARKT